jgi:putative hydrolase of the HAD superfamily
MTLPLQAVVFDYGMVLTEPAHLESKEQMHRITGLTAEQFDSRYWVDRHAYDRGELSGIAYWQKFIADANLPLTDQHVHELNDWDARMWTVINPRMIAWHSALKAHGLKTGILSNMGDNVLERIEAQFEWINDFDVLIWSYQYNLAKPEPEIYHLILEKLGTAPEETLFLDDKIENIEAARKLGIQALVFSTTDQLRQDLITRSYDQDLPLP